MIRYIKKEKLTWPSPRKKNPSLSRKIIYIYTVFHAISFAHNSLKCWSSFLWEKMAYFCYKSQFSKKNHMTKITRRTRTKILKKKFYYSEILLNNFLGGQVGSPIDDDGHFFWMFGVFLQKLWIERKKK